MPRYFFRSAALALCAALACFSVHAATPPEGRPADKAPAAAAPKSSRPLYLSLPESVIHAFRKPVQRIRAWFSHDHAKPALGADADKGSSTDSAAIAPGFVPGPASRPRSSMSFGLAPSLVLPEAPGPYRYSASSTDDSRCQAFNQARDSSTQSLETDNRSSHLLSGLSMGFCMKF
jgi:hypothetical protein